MADTHEHHAKKEEKKEEKKEMKKVEKQVVKKEATALEGHAHEHRHDAPGHAHEHAHEHGHDAAGHAHEHAHEHGHEGEAHAPRPVAPVKKVVATPRTEAAKAPPKAPAPTKAADLADEIEKELKMGGEKEAEAPKAGTEGAGSREQGAGTKEGPEGKTAGEPAKGPTTDTRSPAPGARPPAPAQKAKPEIEIVEEEDAAGKEGEPGPAGGEGTPEGGEGTQKPEPSEVVKKAKKGPKVIGRKKKKKKYHAQPKPEITAEVRRALVLREGLKDKTPNFIRQESYNYIRVGEKWRKPRGKHSKLRHHISYRINVASIGYSGPQAARGLHPSGFREVLVHHPLELDGMDPKTEAARVAHGVGFRKREMIQRRADRMGIRILNEIDTS